MKRLAIVTVILVLAAGVAYAKDYEVKKKTGEFQIAVTIDKNPPIVGDNNLAIEIKDASGKIVTDAKVVIDYSMPAMPGMPAMNYKADAELEGNAYKTKINLSMSGPWSVVVKLTKGGKKSSIKFTVDAK